jgi:hypothetical protein
LRAATRDFRGAAKIHCRLVLAAKPDHPGAEAVDDLRAGVRHLVEVGHPAAQRLFRRLVEYEAGVRCGLTLDDAFDLTPGPGNEPWWRLEDRDRRNTLFRGIARDFSPGVRKKIKQAELIDKALNSFMPVWQRYRTYKALPTRNAGRIEERLFLVMKACHGKPPARETIRHILSERPSPGR